MNSTEKEVLLKSIVATAEVMGGEIKPAAAVLMIDDLAAYPLESCLSALKRCRQEVAGRLTLAPIVERLSGADGRPTANEAWALALRSMDEAETVVLNDEISAALNFARDIFNAGDEIAARLAFRDSYERIVKEARESGSPVKWWPSLGHDVSRRTAAIERAIIAGLLPASQLDALPAPASGGIYALIECASQGVSKEVAQQRIDSIRELFGPKKRPALTSQQVELRRAELLRQAENNGF